MELSILSVLLDKTNTKTAANTVFIQFVCKIFRTMRGSENEYNIH